MSSPNRITKQGKAKLKVYNLTLGLQLINDINEVDKKCSFIKWCEVEKGRSALPQVHLGRGRVKRGGGITEMHPLQVCLHCQHHLGPTSWYISILWPDKFLLHSSEWGLFPVFHFAPSMLDHFPLCPVPLCPNQVRFFSTCITILYANVCYPCYPA